MGGFAEELHGTGAKVPQGFEGNRTERIPRARVLRVVAPALVSIPKSGSVARGASSGRKKKHQIGDHAPI
jgi:hypothetical protein